MDSALIGVCLISILSVVSASCPSLKGVDSFNLTNFFGTWYQQYSYNNIYFQGFGSCAKTVFSEDAETGAINMVNTQTNPFGFTEEIDGYASLKNTTVGDFKVTFESQYGLKISGDFKVLATDYDNYAVIYSCTNFLFETFSCGWILTRSDPMDAGLQKTIGRVMATIASEGGPSLAQFTRSTRTDECS